MNLRRHLIVFSFIISNVFALFAQESQLKNELIVQTLSPPQQSQAFDISVLSKDMGLYLLKFEEEQETERFYQSQLSKDSYLFIGYNYKLEFRDTVPNDPTYPLQSHWNNINDPRWDVNAEAAWSISRGGVTSSGDTIVIALVDDGIDMQHRDLFNQLWVNRSEIENNGIDDDNNGYIDDFRGWNVVTETDSIPTYAHGTHMAGIIGGETNNAIDVAGANWDIQMLPVALDTNSTVAQLIKAFQYVLDQRRLYNENNGSQGAYIVAMNNSFGLRGFQYESAPFWCDFYTSLGEEGILSIGATTSEVFDIDTEGDLPTVCPSNYLVTVAALDNEGRWFNLGLSKTHVDITAPGELVYTTFPDDLIGPVSGSSAATAITTGLVGLIYATECGSVSDLASMDPSEAALFVKEQMLQSGTYNEFLKTKTSSGRFLDYEQGLAEIVRPCDSCAGPTSINIFQSEDTVLITPFNNSDSLIWLRRSIGSTVWDTLGTIEGDSLWFTNGVGCNQWEIAFINICDSVQGLTTQAFELSGLSDCDQCDADYCVPITTNQTDYWIDRVLFNADRALYTGPDLGYATYTDRPAFNFVTNEDNFLQIEFESEDPQQTYSFRVWIDVDHDGSFGADELIGASALPVNNNTQISLNIPFTSLEGVTRMRLAMAPVLADLAPCGKIDGGAIFEDFCVNIRVEDPACPEIDSIEITDRTGQTISVRSFPIVGNNEGLNVRYRKENTSDWTIKAHGQGVFVMEDLEGTCVKYELQIRRVCEFDTSAYSETFIVETECMNSVSEATYQQLEVFPNPFQHAFTIGHLETPEQADLIWMDLQGKIIESQRMMIQEGKRIYPPASLQAGTYIVRIIGKQAAYQVRVIKM